MKEDNKWENNKKYLHLDYGYITPNVLNVCFHSWVRTKWLEKVVQVISTNLPSHS